METIQEVQAYLKREKSGMLWPDAPERMMLEVLEELAGRCQSVEEFVERAQQIPVTGAGIEEVQIANEYREIALEAITG
jgi:hypothetical protein